MPECAPPASNAARAGPPPRIRAAAEFALEGDLRCLSHLDEMRLLARALVRARWPVRYSQGFNPLPRLTLPLPRAVGTASDCEWALVDLREPRPPEELFAGLAAALPAGCWLRRVIAPAGGGTPHARGVRYQIELTALDAERAAPRIAGLLAKEQLTLMRRSGPDKPARPVDIRPLIDGIVLQGRTLDLRLRFAGQVTARPTEILTALDLAAEEYGHRVRRTAVEWDIVLTGPTARPAIEERKPLGKTEETRHEKTDSPEETSEKHAGV